MRAVTLALAAIPVVFGGLGLAAVVGVFDPFIAPTPASEETQISLDTESGTTAASQATGTVIDGRRPHLSVIDGRLQSRPYQDKNGNNRTAIEIIANNINFAGPKSSNSSGGGYAAPAQNSSMSRPAVPEAVPSYSAGSNDDFAVIDDGEDLPF